MVFACGITDEADLDGPSFEATRAFLSKKRRYSYFAVEKTINMGLLRENQRNIHLIYCSRSLSRAGSSNLGGGGFLTSFGL